MIRFMSILLCFIFCSWLMLGGSAMVAALVAGFGWAGLFAVGSIGFWVLISAACVALCLSDERENGVGATATVLVAILLLIFCGDFRPWPWIVVHWWMALLGFAAYFAFGGGAWAVFMLRRRAKAELAKYERAFDLFLSNNQAKSEADLTPEQRFQWQEHRKKGRYMQDFAINKKISDYKSLILYWICYWPTSLLWYLISDFVKEIADEIFRRMQGFYQRVWDGVWAGARGSF